jgi:hypothetical protein
MDSCGLVIGYRIHKSSFQQRAEVEWIIIWALTLTAFNFRKQVPVYYAVVDSTPRIEMFNELILLPVDDGADDDGMVLQDDLT